MQSMHWAEYPPQGAELFRAPRTPGVGEKVGVSRGPDGTSFPPDPIARLFAVRRREKWRQDQPRSLVASTLDVIAKWIRTNVGRTIVGRGNGDSSVPRSKRCFRGDGELKLPLPRCRPGVRGRLPSPSSAPAPARSDLPPAKPAPGCCPTAPSLP